MFEKNIPQVSAPVCESSSRRLSQEHEHPRALALCSNTMLLPNRVVHKLRNKPKFTKPHEETNVCSLWANLYGAPPIKQTSFNSGKLITLGRALCLGHCCFALGAQIFWVPKFCHWSVVWVSLDNSVQIPCLLFIICFVDYCYPHCTRVGLKEVFCN